MNRTFLRPLALTAALVLGMSFQAGAAEYTSLDAEATRMSFAYSQMNVGMEGNFGQIKATDFNFDPEHPEAAKVVIEITLDSIDAGYDEANAELEKDEWLNLAAHPVARFQSTHVQAVGENRYRVTGDLSIKGNTKEMTVPFSFKEDGDKGVFEGAFTFHRADFGIGEGQWKDFNIVANGIKIRFHVVANS